MFKRQKGMNLEILLLKQTYLAPALKCYMLIEKKHACKQLHLTFRNLDMFSYHLPGTKK